MPGIEQPFRVARRGGAGSLRRIGQPAIEALRGRVRGHGRKSGAPVVGGAHIVAACLFEAGGERQNLRIAWKTRLRLVQPGLGLGHILRPKCCRNRSLVIARAGVVHRNGFEERNRVGRPPNPGICARDSPANIQVVRVVLGRCLQYLHTTQQVSLIH